MVEILKKYRSRNALLNGAQKTSFMAELRGAGQWSGTAGKRVTPPAPPSRADGAVRLRSYAAVAASTTADVAALRAEIAALKAATGTVPAEARPSRRARRTAWRINSADAVPTGVPAKAVIKTPHDHADIEVEPSPLWTCPAFIAEHDYSPKKQCRLCKLHRCL